MSLALSMQDSRLASLINSFLPFFFFPSLSVRIFCVRSSCTVNLPPPSCTGDWDRFLPSVLCSCLKFFSTAAPRPPIPNASVPGVQAALARRRTILNVVKTVMQVLPCT